MCLIFFRTHIQPSTTFTGPALSAILSAKTNSHPWYLLSSKTSSAPQFSPTSYVAVQSVVRECTNQKCLRHRQCCLVTSRRCDSCSTLRLPHTSRRLIRDWAASRHVTTPNLSIFCSRLGILSCWLTMGPCSLLSWWKIWSWLTRARKNLSVSSKRGLDKSKKSTTVSPRYIYNLFVAFKVLCSQYVVHRNSKNGLYLCGSTLNVLHLVCILSVKRPALRDGCIFRTRIMNKVYCSVWQTTNLKHRYGPIQKIDNIKQSMLTLTTWTLDTSE